MRRQQKRAASRAAAKSASRREIKPQEPSPDQSIVGQPRQIKAEDLDDRKVRGVCLYESIQNDSTLFFSQVETDTVYFSIKDRNHNSRVIRELRNKRGTLTAVYRCSCKDYLKDGRNDCQHIFCDRIRRNEVVVIGEISSSRAKSARADRRPPRKRATESGKAHRSTQRDARVKMPREIPRLITSLRDLYERSPVTNVREFKRGGQMTADITRAMALIYKIARKKSADEMISHYVDLIAGGFLRLEDPPHQNTLSNWMNDDSLTPVLRELLRLTTLPFRKREIAAIIDSTKLSQMSTARGRGVDYLKDDRPNADWMKAHVIVGVETTIVMAVEFSGIYGNGVADVKFLKTLVTEARKTFPLQILLADKGYTGEDYLNWLWKECRIRAFIPIKKNASRRKKQEEYEPLYELMTMFEDSPQKFHESYRLRSKIEGFFSTLKRISGEHCWSRGRPRRDAAGKFVSVDNSTQPCTAWINETLCKCIYMNLRTTASLQEETGYEIEYPVDNRFFPAPIEPLIAA